MKQFTDQPIGCRTKVEQMWGKRRDMTVRDRSPFNAEPRPRCWPMPRSRRSTRFTAAIMLRSPTLHVTNGASWSTA